MDSDELVGIYLATELKEILKEEPNISKIPENFTKLEGDVKKVPSNQTGVNNLKKICYECIRIYQKDPKFCDVDDKKLEEHIDNITDKKYQHFYLDYFKDNQKEIVNYVNKRLDFEETMILPHNKETEENFKFTITINTHHTDTKTVCKQIIIKKDQEYQGNIHVVSPSVDILRITSSCFHNSCILCNKSMQCYHYSYFYSIKYFYEKYEKERKGERCVMCKNCTLQLYEHIFKIEILKLRKYNKTFPKGVEHEIKLIEEKEKKKKEESEKLKNNIFFKLLIIFCCILLILLLPFIIAIGGVIFFLFYVIAMLSSYYCPTKKVTDKSTVENRVLKEKKIDYTAFNLEDFKNYREILKWKNLNKNK